MLSENEVVNAYFEWLYNIATKGMFSKNISFRKLLMRLHSTEFIYTIPKDGGRAEDGIDLRYRFFHEYAGKKDAENYIKGPCSVLEMILALAIRCEETIMDNPKYGDRTKQWFWGMITNLGLGSMEDSRFDRDYVDTVLDIFLKRRYRPDGKGGLFTVRNRDEDLTKVEIWYQLCWYLNTINC